MSGSERVSGSDRVSKVKGCPEQACVQRHWLSGESVVRSKRLPLASMCLERAAIQSELLSGESSNPERPAVRSEQGFLSSLGS